MLWEAAQCRTHSWLGNSNTISESPHYRLTSFEGTPGGQQSNKLLKVEATMLGCPGLYPVKVLISPKLKIPKLFWASFFSVWPPSWWTCFSYHLVRIPHVAMCIQLPLTLPLGTWGRVWINLPHTRPAGNSNSTKFFLKHLFCRLSKASSLSLPLNILCSSSSLASWSFTEFNPGFKCFSCTGNTKPHAGSCSSLGSQSFS